MGKWDLLDAAGGSINRCNLYGGQFGNTIGSLKNDHTLGLGPERINRVILKDLSIGIVIATLFIIVANWK